MKNKKSRPNPHKTDNNPPIVRTYVRARAEKHIYTKSASRRVASSRFVASSLAALPNDPQHRYNSTRLRTPGATLEHALPQGPSSNDAAELLLKAANTIERCHRLIDTLTDGFSTVSALHQPNEHFGTANAPVCAECLKTWPCPTIETFRTALLTWFQGQR